jgi:hypothetical protein
MLYFFSMFYHQCKLASWVRGNKSVHTRFISDELDQLMSFVCSAVLGMEARASRMLGKCSTTELYFQLYLVFLSTFPIIMSRSWGWQWGREASWTASDAKWEKSPSLSALRPLSSCWARQLLRSGDSAEEASMPLLWVSGVLCLDQYPKY